MKIAINFNTGFQLTITLRDIDFVHRWARLLESELQNSSLMQDHIYSSLMTEIQCQQHLRQAILTVNKFLKKEFIAVPTDQDFTTDNYFNDLHQKFEQLAGDDWDRPTRLVLLAPDAVKKAIKDINRFCRRLERRPYRIDPFMRIEFNTAQRLPLLEQDYELFEPVDHDDNVERDLLSYIAYAQMGKTALSDNTVVLFLGTWKAVVKLMAEKKIKFDEGDGPMEIDP
jgi:hypothetical protein